MSRIVEVIGPLDVRKADQGQLDPLRHRYRARGGGGQGTRQRVRPVVEGETDWIGLWAEDPRGLAE